MPSRPRSHELEELSRQAFRRNLPTAWIVRDQLPDYGVDAMVQVVRDGDVTPEFFGVQIKGTDSPSRSDDEATFSFETNHLRHYLDLRFPVCLVVFDATRNRLFVAWTHRVYAGLDVEARRRWREQATVTVRLTDILTAESRVGIEREVRAYYDRPRSEVQGDFAIELVIEDLPDSERQIRDGIASWAAGVKSCSLLFWSDTYEGTICIRPGNVSLEVRGRRLDIPLPSLSSDIEWTHQAIAATEVACSYTLFAAGRPQAAINVLVDVLTELREIPPAVEAALWTPSVAVMFASTRRTGDALSIAEDLLRRHEVNAAVAVAAAVVADPSPTEIDRGRHERFLEGAIASSDSRPHRASLHYNLANAFRARNSRQALKHYRSASIDDPSYRERPYWWREVAGCLFVLNRYRFAEAAYRRAAEAAELKDDISRALLGDTLLRLGRFREAARELSTYLANASRPTSDALLHLWAARELDAAYGDVRRRPGESTALNELALSAENSIRKRELLQRAATADPLSNLTWFNLGVLENENGPARSWREFLLAAVAVEGDVVSWAYACTIQMAVLDARDLLIATIATAYRLHGSSLEGQVATLMQASGASHNTRTGQIASLRRIANEASKIFAPSTERVLRWFPA